MYGWRCNVGLIVPIDNAIIEPELNEVLPDGVALNTARLNTMELPAMPDDAEEEAENLGTMGADVIAYACNASSFYDGLEGDEAIAEGLAMAAGVPATTASMAMAEALAFLGLETIGVVTPYDEADTERLNVYLAERGFEVEAVSGLGLASDDPGDLAAVNEQTAFDTYHRVRETDSSAVDGVLVTATNLASLRTIAAAETDIQKPVISTNQALLWHSLRVAGVDPQIDGYGRLLESA